MRHASLLLLLLTVASPSVVSAQISADGSIRGTVTDQQRAVMPGVTITLTGTGTSVAGRDVTVTDLDGTYRFPNVRPGEYFVTAELQGFTKLVRHNIVIRAGLNVAIDLTMSVGSMTETIEVKAETPLLETETAQQAMNIDGELKRRLPLSAGRDWNDILTLIPGTVGTNGAGLSMHGSVYESHVMQIDGADMAPSGQNLTSLMNLSAEAFQDVQVKAAGMNASSPLGLGAVINVATRSGTNTIRGAAGAVYQYENWYDRGDRTGTISAGNRVQPDGAIGGPIVKDKWFWFGSYRYTSTNTGIARSAAEIDLYRKLKPDFQPFNFETKASYYFVKGTGQLNRNHRVQAFYQYDTTPSRSGSFNLLHPMVVVETGGPGYSAMFNSVWSSSFTTRVNASYNNKKIDIDLLDYSQPARPIYESVFRSGSTLQGRTLLAWMDNSGQTAFLQPYEKATISADATWYKRGWLGTHEVQIGLYAQPMLHVEIDNKYPANGFIQEAMVLNDPTDPTKGFRPFLRSYRDRDELKFQYKDGSDYAVYLQDNWRPTNRLTVNAGVRLDRIEWTDKIFNVLTQRSVEVGPRFGAVYSLTADRKNILRGSWSIIHQAPSGNYAPDASGQNFAGSRVEYDLDLNGTFETVFESPGRTVANATRVVDETYHQPYTRELVLGYRRQFRGLLAVDLGFVQREFKDRATAVEYNAIYEQNVFKGYRDETANMLYMVQNNKWNWPVYRALELSLTKQTQKLQIIASYTRQFRHLEGTWQPNDPAAIVQPEVFPTDRAVGRSQTTPNNIGEANSLTTGNLFPDIWGNMWQDHVVRIAGNWMAPWGLVVANNYIYQSGPWSGPIFTRIAAADPQYGPATLRLSNGRAVQNPLATTIRFVGPTRGDGQFTPEPLHVWNLRLGKDFQLPRSRRLELALDIFNVANFNKETGFAAGHNQDFSLNFRKTQGTQPPRTFLVSTRLQF